MAAKPPKPPGFLLKRSNNDESGSDRNSNNCNNSNNNGNNIHRVNGVNTLNNNYNNSNSNNSNNNKCSVENNTTDSITNNSNITTTTNIAKANCNCTNISIMHLFHEMKQEFPTIPDTIVTQCVNENCHQRDNCIQMLRNELAANPMPAQAYPAKVLQQQRQQQVKLQTQHSLQKPPTPLKPTRAAPTHPPIVATKPTKNIQLTQTSSRTKFNNCHNPAEVKNCDSHSASASEITNSNKVNKKFKDVYNSHTNSVITQNSVGESTSDMPAITKTITPTQRALTSVNSVSDMQECSNYETTNNTATPTANNNNNNNNNSINNNNNTAVTEIPFTPPQHPPRARPTTLNLQTQQQRQQQQQQQQQQVLEQRQQLHVQLQQHIQQRNQQQLLQQKQQSPLPHRPLRKAPLPPIPPKPSQFTSNNAVSPQIHHNNSLHSQQSSFSNESSTLTSPISSGESEISVNFSLSSPTAHQHTPHNNNQLKSPIRHRSVITVQPEPPYTRDFLVSPTSSNCSAVNNSQKSYTTVNLTLRQPSASVPQSTIDISAGPALNGNGTGLTYSSTSYDARRGYQKNFHITVTDEGGVFSASRIRPRSCVYPAEEEENDSITGNGGVNPLRTASSEHNVLDGEQQQLYQYTNQQQKQNQMQLQHSTVAIGNAQFNDMCLSKEFDGSYKTIERQKSKRDKLATALRDNKKRLQQVEQEINLLTEQISPGLTERLDSDIQRLRSDCQDMLNEIETKRGPSVTNNQNCVSNFVNNGSQSQLQSQQQIQPQPFPRQRPSRPPPITGILNQQQHLDFVQHHSNSSTPTGVAYTSPLTTTPIINTPNSLQQQQITTPIMSQSPLTYEQYYQLQQQQQQQQLQPLQQSQPHYTDDEEYSDYNTDDNEEEEPLEMWACNMCTFRNHPQLNMCECCENVRILPRTLRISPTTIANTDSTLSAVNMNDAINNNNTHNSSGNLIRGIGIITPTNGNVTNATANVANSNTSLENDANLTQQQLQQFALHT